MDAYRELEIDAREFLPVLREMARCYQSFTFFAAKHVRELGLTTSQFDVIATLGNTEGMTFKHLGEKTLITKGTLTGVVDRLVAKKLVRRIASPKDGRSQIVQLTAEGNAVFERVFPKHLEYLGKAFDEITAHELQEIQGMLLKLSATFKRAMDA